MVFFLQVSKSQTKVHEGQIGIRGGGELQFSDSFVDLFAVEVGLAEDEVELGSLAADLDEAVEGFRVEVVLLGIVSGDIKGVKVG